MAAGVSPGYKVKGEGQGSNLALKLACLASRNFAQTNNSKIHLSFLVLKTSPYPTIGDRAKTFYSHLLIPQSS